MPITFTSDQRQVIELHNCNILVSAAAGSGKTAVLVERIVRMVCDEEHPVDIDRLLIVTFTNAAAAEMRERISDGIAARLQQCPESEHIQRQAALLHNAQITTIDSFSLFLIRNHFHEIGLDPAFRVADEGEVKLMRQDVLAGLLEDAFASGDEGFRDCVEFFCPGGKEKVLEDHILNLAQYAASFPWPEEWLRDRKGDYGAKTPEELYDGPDGQYLERHMRLMLEGCIEKMEQVRALCESPDGPYMYGALVDGEIELLNRLRECDTLRELGERLPTVVFERLPSKKDDSVSPVKRELAKSHRSQVKDTLHKLGEKFFRTPPELAREQAAECAAPLGTLIDLTLEFMRRMQQCKQERKVIDFSDMEHYALQILAVREGEKVRPSAVAMEYRQYFHEIMTDEYQDSNLVQEYLLGMLSGEEEGRYNRFMVGDVKQSIYKFRQASPELFLEKYHTYHLTEGSCRRIDLARNFRSRGQVVDTVNAVFSRIMTPETGGIVYDDRAALYAGASFPETKGCESELLLVEKPEKKQAAGGQAAEEQDGKAAEALAIAHKIKNLREQFQVTDKATGALRAVRYSDIVILLRTTSGWDEEFRSVLEGEGIPVYIASKTGYFAASEVQELLQVLRVLDNPTQDIPLYGMLKSVFGGFSEEEIAQIRAGRKRMSLYGALREFAADGAGDETLRQRVEAFLSMLQEYRFFTTYMPIRELLQRLTEDHDYLNYVTALPAGGKRRANVEMLFTKASDFERTSYFGLFHFIRYMDQLEKYDVDYGEADMLDENADVVRIMSIHKSKGLEFPVTFVAGLSKRFNMQDTNRSLIVDTELGIGVDYVNPVRRIRSRTLRRNILAEKMREDSLAEELRVLYVALTRAREKLILTAALENPEEKWDLCRENPSAKLSYLDFMEAAGFLDFLFPILPDTGLRVQVVTSEESEGAAFREQTAFAVKRVLLEQAGQFADREELQKIHTRFQFVYPYQSLEKLYTKTTVSELKIAAMAEKDEAAFHSFEEREVVPYIPKFRREKETVSGTVRGNAFHRAMEILDFPKILGAQFGGLPKSYGDYREGLHTAKLAEDLTTFLEKEKESLRISEEYCGALHIGKLVHFLQTPLAYRMWAADLRGELYREQPFVLGVSAGRLGPEFPEEEEVLIQGIIDVFFVEKGELVLLDYKTDVISSMEELWNRYEVQLQYYEEALRRMMGMDVKEKILYSFYLECGNNMTGVIEND